MKKLCGKAVKGNTSSRSFRVGASTVLRCNPNITWDQQAMIMGLHPPDATKNYTKACLELVVAPAKVLAGADPNTHVCAPTLDCLSMGDDLEGAIKLMDQIFVVSVPDLKKGGRLYTLTKTMMAALLMHHGAVSLLACMRACALLLLACIRTLRWPLTLANIRTVHVLPPAGCAAIHLSAAAA